MDEELIELCPVCSENEAIYFTECNHKYCITCLSRIKKCAMCRKVLQRSLICIEICNKVKRINEIIHSIQLRTGNSQLSDAENSTFSLYSDNDNVLRIMVGLGGVTYSN